MFPKQEICGAILVTRLLRARRSLGFSQKSRTHTIDGYKKLCGSMSTDTRTEPLIFGPAASMSFI